MRANGTLQYKTTSAGGIDVNGDSIQAVEAWSDPIDCLLFPNSSGRLMKYQDGEYVAASYEVNLEQNDFTHTAIRIFDNGGYLQGEFQVLPQNVYRYSMINRVKITV